VLAARTNQSGHRERSIVRDVGPKLLHRRSRPDPCRPGWGCPRTVAQNRKASAGIGGDQPEGMAGPWPSWYTWESYAPVSSLYFFFFLLNAECLCIQVGAPAIQAFIHLKTDVSRTSAGQQSPEKIEIVLQGSILTVPAHTSLSRCSLLTSVLFSTFLWDAALIIRHVWL